MKYIFLHEPSHGISLNWKNILVVLIKAQLIAQTMTFFLFQATSNRERGDSYYVCATALVCINHYMIFSMKKMDTQRIIKQFDEFIEKSE